MRRHLPDRSKNWVGVHILSSESESFEIRRLRSPAHNFKEVVNAEQLRFPATVTSVKVGSRDLYPNPQHTSHPDGKGRNKHNVLLNMCIK